MKLADDNTIYGPGRIKVDIGEMEEIENYMNDMQFLPNVIVNAAAFTKNTEVQENIEEVISTNIIGAANVAYLCAKKGIPLVYISTDYVYGDDKGYYKEDSPLLPANDYAWSKLAGECSAQLVPEHLIIRTSFGHRVFPYVEAFTNRYVSKGYVEEIAPLIMQAITSGITGTINIGNPGQSMYDYAKENHAGVSKGLALEPPYDTTMSLHKMENEMLCIKGREYKEVTRCRACGSHNLYTLIELGQTTLPNVLCDTAEESMRLPKYPLELLKCRMCHMIQLSIVVEPDEMFSTYPYRSSMSKTYLNHCREMATSLKDLPLGKDDLVVDIAGNDGALLSEFYQTLKVRVVNIEPAENLAEISEHRNIPVIEYYWGHEAATELLQVYGRPKVITATNVLAHVDDLDEFFSACHSVMGEDSILIIEVPYAAEMIKKNEFDTIYHEHLSYFLLSPLMMVAKRNLMRINDVEEFPIHGGTMRVTLSRTDSIYPSNSRVDKLLKMEREGKWLTSNSYNYTSWGDEIYKECNSIRQQVDYANNSGEKVVAFAASAKGAMLLQAAGLDKDDIAYVIDDTPEKEGKFMPGLGIPIIRREEAFDHTKEQPTIMIILSWNFAKEIKHSLREQFTGPFIIPIIGNEEENKI